MNTIFKEMNLKEQETFKSWLSSLLKNEVVTITFTKKDETERVMKATLNERLVANTSGLGHKENNDVIRVTDVEIDQWRSIRYDSIKEIHFDINNNDQNK